MFRKRKNKREASDSYMDVFLPPVVLALLRSGMREDYAKVMANHMIDKAIADFKSMEMTRYIQFHCENELARIKAGLEARKEVGKTHETAYNG